MGSGKFIGNFPLNCPVTPNVIPQLYLWKPMKKGQGPHQKSIICDTQPNRLKHDQNVTSKRDTRRGEKGQTSLKERKGSRPPQNQTQSAEGPIVLGKKTCVNGRQGRLKTGLNNYGEEKGTRKRGEGNMGGEVIQKKRYCYKSTWTERESESKVT